MFCHQLKLYRITALAEEVKCLVLVSKYIFPSSIYPECGWICWQGWQRVVGGCWSGATHWHWEPPSQLVTCCQEKGRVCHAYLGVWAASAAMRTLLSLFIYLLILFIQLPSVYTPELFWPDVAFRSRLGLLFPDCCVSHPQVIQNVFRTSHVTQPYQGPGVCPASWGHFAFVHLLNWTDFSKKESLWTGNAV